MFSLSIVIPPSVGYHASSRVVWYSKTQANEVERWRHCEIQHDSNSIDDHLSGRFVAKHTPKSRNGLPSKEISFPPDSPLKISRDSRFLGIEGKIGLFLWAELAKFIARLCLIWLET